MEKRTAVRQAANKVAAQHSVVSRNASQFAINPWFRLQRSIGNHAVQRLLHNGVLQAKLANSPPGDPYEQEADRAAEQVSVGTSIAAIQRKCACGNHTMSGSECEGCSRKKRLGLQTKLKVNEPGDTYEQEADRVADQVLATPVQPAVSGSPSHIQRFSGQPAGQTDSAPASVDQVLSSPGRPLEPALRQDMEHRFGYDFSRVRVHTGAAAEQSAQDVNSEAYTVGHNVVFGENKYAPTTHAGRELLAHELAHTIQQRGASISEETIPPGSALENTAEQAGRDAASGRAVMGSLGSSNVAVARQPVAAGEEEEEEDEATLVPMALPVGKGGRGAPLRRSTPRTPPPRRRPPTKFEPGGFHAPVREGGEIITEFEEALEPSNREEEEKRQKEVEESHDRLQMLRGKLDPSRSGYIYNKDKIMALITKHSLLDGQILRHYGVELPPSRFTKRKTFTDQVIDAIDKFDYEWRKSHGTFSTAGPTNVEALAARQSQQEAEAAGWEGYSYVTESAAAGAGASATRLFTADPKKIAAGAGLGAAAGGSLGAVGYAKGQQGTYSPEVEGPGPFANPVGPWRYSGPAPTTQESIPPGGGGGGTIVAYPPPMPKPPAPISKLRAAQPAALADAIAASQAKPSSVIIQDTGWHNQIWILYQGGKVVPPVFRTGSKFTERFWVDRTRVPADLLAQIRRGTRLL